MYANYLGSDGLALRVAVPVTDENGAKRRQRPHEALVKVYEYASLATHAAELFGCAPGVDFLDGAGAPPQVAPQEETLKEEDHGTGDHATGAGD